MLNCHQSFSISSLASLYNLGVSATGPGKVAPAVQVSEKVIEM